MLNSAFIKREQLNFPFFAPINSTASLACEILSDANAHVAAFGVAVKRSARSRR